MRALFAFPTCMTLPQCGNNAGPTKAVKPPSGGRPWRFCDKRIKRAGQGGRAAATGAKARTSETRAPVRAKPNIDICGILNGFGLGIDDGRISRANLSLQCPPAAAPSTGRERFDFRPTFLPQERDLSALRRRRTIFWWASPCLVQLGARRDGERRCHHEEALMLRSSNTLICQGDWSM